MADGEYPASLHVVSNDPELNEVHIDVLLEVADVDLADAVQLPQAFELGQAYPNPFNPVTHVDFALPTATMVTAKLYNVMGQEVASLWNQRPMQAGRHKLLVDASALSSGLYLLQMQAGSESAVRKMMLVK